MIVLCSLRSEPSWSNLDRMALPKLTDSTLSRSWNKVSSVSPPSSETSADLRADLRVDLSFPKMSETGGFSSSSSADQVVMVVKDRDKVMVTGSWAWSGSRSCIFDKTSALLTIVCNLNDQWSFNDLHKTQEPFLIYTNLKDPLIIEFQLR